MADNDLDCMAEKGKKSLFGKLIDKFDKGLEEKAKDKKCCCCDSEEKQC